MTWIKTGCLLTATLAITATAAAGADWPQLRGPERDGHSPETGLHLDWSDGAPPELWRHPIGPGYAAVSAVGGRLYTAYADATEAGEDGEPAGKEYAVALDAATGQEVWRVELGAKTFNEFGHGPRATPTIAGDLVVYLSGHGRVAALDRETGETRWSVELKEATESPMPTYGFTSSALVEGDLVILDAGGAGEGRSHVALDRASGKLVWAGGNPMWGEAGYSSVVPVDLAGQRQLVHKAGVELRSVDAEGNVHWTFEMPSGESHSMPIFVPPNRVYASGAAPVGAVLVEIKKDGSGFAVEEVWRTHLMRNHFSSAVYHEGYVYGFDNATLKCLDAATGEATWARRGLGKGSLIVVEGHLVVLSDRGRLLVAPASPEGFQELGSVQALTGKSWTAPSLADGVLYLRNHSEVVAYDLRPGGGAS